MRYRRLLLVMLFAIALPAWGDAMKIHVLERADAAGLVPVVRPLLVDGATVRAYRGKLIIRTTDANLSQLRGVLGSLSGPPATLVVHLRRRAQRQEHRRAVGGSASIDSDGDGKARITLQDRQRQQQRQDRYQVRTLSGHPARISQGTLLALSAGWRGTALVNLDQGIQALPTIGPDGSITLRIAQSFDRADGQAIHTQGSASTLRLQPGQWQPLGRITVSSDQQQSGIGQTQQRQQQLSLPLEVMVELGNE